MGREILPLYKEIDGYRFPHLYSWADYKKIDLTKFHTIQTEKVQAEERLDLAQWCSENCESPYGLVYYSNWIFESEQDALMFKLAWGGARWTPDV